MSGIAALTAVTLVIVALMACIVWLARLDGRNNAIQERDDAEKAALAKMDKAAQDIRDQTRTDGIDFVRDRLRRNAYKD